MFAFCSTPGLLKQFIADLHSGKLHREYHNGPDPTDVKPNDVGFIDNFHLYLFSLSTFIRFVSVIVLELNFGKGSQITISPSTYK